VLCVIAELVCAGENNVTTFSREDFILVAYFQRGVIAAVKSHTAHAQKIQSADRKRQKQNISRMRTHILYSARVNCSPFNKIN